jgi:hypothetical protein
MWWLWIAGPLVAALVFLLTDWRDKRRDAEIERWRGLMTTPPSTRKEAAGYRDVKETKQGGIPAPELVSALPGPLLRLVLAAGGGQRIGYYALVPKLAYLAVMGGDATNGSDHQTVVAKLDESAPTFTVRPLPILDGQREPNTGVQFKKDAEFMEAFIVDRFLEGSDVEGAAPNEATDKAIRKWLSPPVRAALMELPDLWIRVEGKTMALSLYGRVDADRLHALVTAADVIFAEYGAEGGPSLFGDDEEEDEAEPEPKPAPAPKKAGGTKKPAQGKSA